MNRIIMTRPVPHPSLAKLADFLHTHHRIFVLTGAGCSTDSGIPDYRDNDGAWKRAAPMTWQTFMGHETARARYWARSMIGWRRFSTARANATHAALARLEQRGRIELLVTQNVDRLHQRAGGHRVVDLHGRLDRVRCMHCRLRLARQDVQEMLYTLNPRWDQLAAGDAPDGDADLDVQDFSSFRVPPCPSCGGILKPDVVFFGENVPRRRVQRAMHHLQRADALLIVGSSLMVYSGYRFAVAASRQELPIAAINLGRTRADPLLTLKVDAPCAQALQLIH